MDVLHELKPFDIRKYIERGDLKFQSGLKYREYVIDGNVVRSGQIDEDTNALIGIGLRVFENGTVQEGQFDVNMNGFGRYIFPSGNYYLGYFKNNL